MRHKSHLKRLKTSKDKFNQGERRTPAKGLNVRLKVQFKGPNLSGTLESNDPLNPKEGDVTLAAVQNAEQGDPSYEQKKLLHDNQIPFYLEAGTKSNKQIHEDVVIQASRMQDGTVQTSTSVRPKDVPDSQRHSSENRDDLFHDSLQPELMHDDKGATNASLNTTESTKQDKEKKGKSSSLQGILETLKRIKAIKDNEPSSSKDKEEMEEGPLKSTEKNQKSEEKKKDEKNFQESSKPIVSLPKQETNGGILLLINKNQNNSSREKDQEQAGGNAIVIMPNIGTKLPEKNVKADAKEESSVQNANVSVIEHKKEVERKNGDTSSQNINIESNGSEEILQKSANQSKKEDDNSLKVEVKSEKTKDKKEQKKPIGENLLQNETTKPSDEKTSSNPFVKSEHEKPKDDETNRDKQDATAISGLIGLIGNIVQNKLQSKLNTTQEGSKIDSTYKSKKELEKNISIGKLNITLQTADPVKLQRQPNHLSYEAKNEKPAATLNQEKTLEKGPMKSVDHHSFVSADDSNVPNNKITELKNAFNDTATKQANEPVMRIRLKGPDSIPEKEENIPQQNKEVDNAIIVKSVRHSDSSSKNDAAGYKPKALHTTTVIIRNFNKEGKQLSYGSEDQFDTLPMKGSDSFDAYGNRKLPSPVISMNDADDLLAGDKALIDNSAMSNTLFNPDAATFSERKEDMKIGKQDFGNAMDKSDEDAFAQAILHQDDNSKLHGKMTFKENDQSGQTPIKLPNEKTQAFKNHRFKDVEKPNVAKPHWPVVNGYNNYGSQQTEMQNQGINDAQMGINIGKGVQMGMSDGTGGGPGLSPMEMQPIKGNSQEVENSMNQAISNMQDMAMKQIQQRYPGMQITMKSNDEEEEEEQPQGILS